MVAPSLFRHYNIKTKVIENPDDKVPFLTFKLKIIRNLLKKLMPLTISNTSFTYFFAMQNYLTIENFNFHSKLTYDLH